MRDKWRNEWQNTNGNKLRVIKDSISVWPSSQQRVRKDSVVLARLRIGHTHGYLIKGGRMPYCGDCLVPLSIKHLLVECPSYRDERWRHYPALQTVQDQALSLVLADDRDRVFNINTILAYIKELNIYNKI